MAFAKLPASGRSHIMAEINITPLTDIFLVLLIIFMVTSVAMVDTGAKVMLPEVDSTQSAPREITITVTPLHEIYVNADLVGLDGLEGTLKTLARHPSRHAGRVAGRSRGPARRRRPHPVRGAARRRDAGRDRRRAREGAIGRRWPSGAAPSHEPPMTAPQKPPPPTTIRSPARFPSDATCRRSSSRRRSTPALLLLLTTISVTVAKQVQKINVKIIEPPAALEEADVEGAPSLSDLAGQLRPVIAQPRHGRLGRGTERRRRRSPTCAAPDLPRIGVGPSIGAQPGNLDIPLSFGGSGLAGSGGPGRRRLRRPRSAASARSASISCC